MRQIAERLLKIASGASLTSQMRALSTYAATGLVLVLNTLLLLTLPYWSPPGARLGLARLVPVDDSLLILAMLVVMYTAGTAAFVMARQGRIAFAGWVTIAMWFVGGVLLSLLFQPALAAAGGALMVFIVLTTLLHLDRGLLVGVALTLLSTMIAYALRSTLEPFVQIIPLLFNIAGVSLLSYLALRYFKQATTQSTRIAAEQRRRTEAVAELVMRLTADREEAQSLLQTVVQRIKQDFATLSVARVYLVNENGIDAYLAADSGVADTADIIPTRLGVGGLSPVGQVTLRGTYDLSFDQEHNQVTAVFPMHVGQRILGALEMQTRDHNLFEGEGMMRAVQALTDIISLSVDNARLYERVEQQVRENKDLSDAARRSRMQLEAATRELTRESWQRYLQSTPGSIGFSADFEDDIVEPDTGLTPTLEEAIRINHLVQSQVDDRQVIAVPLRVRGQVVGAMEFEIDEENPFTPEDFELIREVGDRFGLAAENTRLVQESQRTAQREALVNQISAQLQATNDVRTSLLEAARGLREALNADRVAIRLGMPAENDAAPHESQEGRAS